MGKELGQFGHVESYGVKTSRARGRGANANKQAKTNVRGACGEASRISGFCGHVDESEKPTLMFGLDPWALQEKIAELANEQEAEAIANGERKPRGDRLVLTAGVFSYPLDVEADDPTLKSWLTDCLDYLQTEYGENLKSVVLHLDEANPHIHFFLCDFKTLRVDGGLDPAKTAQHRSRVLKDPTAPRQVEALKAWQDSFYKAVGIKYQHARTLEARKRVHGKPKAVREALALLEQAKQLREEIARIENRERAVKETYKKVQDYSKAKAEKLQELHQQVQSQKIEIEQQAREIARFITETEKIRDEFAKNGKTAQANEVGLKLAKFRHDIAKSTIAPAVQIALKPRAPVFH